MGYIFDRDKPPDKLVQGASLVGFRGTMGQLEVGNGALCTWKCRTRWPNILTNLIFSKIVLNYFNNLDTFFPRNSRLARYDSFFIVKTDHLRTKIVVFG